MEVNTHNVHYYMRFILTCFIFVIFFCGHNVFAKDVVNLLADHIYYDETSRYMIASDNVKLVMADVTVHASYLTIDTEKEFVWGTGNIMIQRGGDIFHSSYFLV